MPYQMNNTSFTMTSLFKSHFKGQDHIKNCFYISNTIFSTLRSFNDGYLNFWLRTSRQFIDFSPNFFLVHIWTKSMLCSAGSPRNPALFNSSLCSDFYFIHYFYLQVKVYFQYETIGFTLCVAQRSSVECIIHEFQTRQRQKQQIGWF